ncbi:DNA alkylation repair protein [Flaviaesturariibacter aridisoli]|nr:DNA alkylation repair protein [Flaviaesturariibacter aridisoli]
MPGSGISKASVKGWSICSGGSGQFTPARGGQFAPAPGGQLPPAQGGQYRRRLHLDKETLFALCEDLFRSGKMEEGHIAAAWTWSRRKEFGEAELDRFERWIDRYVTNWAVCDNFCNKAVGALFTRFPALLPRTEAWALSPNRWTRRAAAVSLIAPARKGLFLEESFRVADLLLTDADDLVQKGYGWLLKEQGKKNEAALYAFVEARKDRMPRTALRYAIEKMGAADRAKLMARG